MGGRSTERIAVTARTIAPEIAPTAAHVHALPRRRDDGATLTDFERRVRIDSPWNQDVSLLRWGIGAVATTSPRLRGSPRNIVGNPSWTPERRP